MKTTAIYFMLLVALFSSCKKDSSTSTPAATTTTPTVTYFIEGKVDGVMHHAEYVCPNSGCAMVTGNYDEFMHMVNMQRTMSVSNDVGWDIHISNVTLDSWVIPDTLDASDLTANVNLALSYYSGPWMSDNNYLVDGVVLGDNSFAMIVTSKTGDVIEGKFSGMLRNGSNTSLTKTVTEGKFKIKLVRI